MATEYPEHEKMRAVSDESQKIGGFLEWLFNEHGFQICEFKDQLERYVRVHQTIEQWLADYFEIDLDKISQEKQAMYDALVAANKVSDR